MRIPLPCAIPVLLLATLLQAQEPAPVWRALVPGALRAALEPLAAHRRAGGWTVEILDAARALDPSVGAGASVLLLVGDVPGPGESPEPAWHLPAPRRELYRWRTVQPPTFLADGLLGDRDGDLVPEIPVGRLPCRRPEELSALVAKILAYEGRNPGPPDLRVVAWACAPGYGGAVDQAATAVFQGVVDRNLPAALEARLFSAAPGEPIGGPIEEQPGLFLAALEQGFGLAAVAAHASRDAILVAREEERAIRLTRSRVAGRPPAGFPGGALVLLACDAGDFAGPEPCVAEAFLSAPGGPVAVIAATTESHPLTNFHSGQELARSLGGPSTNFGELWREAQERASRARSLVMDRMLRDVEGKLEPSIDVAKLRRDQLLMYAFLGDPATPRPRWRELELQVEAGQDSATWRVVPPAGWEEALVGFRAEPRAAQPDGSRPRRRGGSSSARPYEEIARCVPPSDCTGPIPGEGALRVLVRRGRELWIAAGPVP
jgi:hypothetical protein